jgi:hypothetical protein
VKLPHDVVLEVECCEQRLDLGERQAAVPLALLEEGDDLVREIDSGVLWTVDFGMPHVIRPRPEALPRRR